MKNIEYKFPKPILTPWETVNHEREASRIKWRAKLSDQLFGTDDESGTAKRLALPRDAEQVESLASA